jgi:DNA mismatch endonuclease (patch repair protein)
MSRIRGKGNKDTEIALAKLLRANGITGWKRQVKLAVRRPIRAHPCESVANRAPSCSVRPDFVFPKKHLAIFVDGCFWHGCPIHSSPAKWLAKSSMSRSAHSSNPRPTLALATSSVGVRSYQSRRTGKQFWRSKLLSNLARDKFVTNTLRRQGWKVLRIWEHELTAGHGQTVLRKISRTFNEMWPASRVAP